MFAAAALATIFLGWACSGGEQVVEERGISIRYSKFEPTTLTVPAGVPVTISLENGDPIEHEWMVGDEAMHERHRTGTEPFHDEIPTEVSLRAYQTRETTIQFDEPGEYLFICHLPGHEAYGMVGTLRVVEG
ncbi:MAG: cupredoxin domain-containing protein [Dehalococcoidia bacterium]